MRKGVKKIIKYLLLGSVLAKFFSWLFNLKRVKALVDNFEDLVEAEAKHIKKFAKHEERLDELVVSSGSLFKDYFIPGVHNDERPKILRTKLLAIVVLIAVIIKASVLGYLFWLYPSPAVMSNSIVQAMLSVTNETRLEHDLPEYVMNSALNEAALAKARDMVANDYFAHHSPDGTKPWEWIDQDNYQYVLVGENLAMNFSSAESLQTALMLSADHRKNILSQQYQDVGVAVVDGYLKGKQTNVLVMLFATTKAPELTAIATAQTRYDDQSELVGQAVIASDELEAPDLEEVVTETTIPKSTIKLSPNLILENQPNQEIAWLSVSQTKSLTWANRLILWSKYVYVAILTILIILLLINILVRITKQRGSIIIPTILVLVLLSGLIMVRLHILENILDKVALV